MIKRNLLLIVLVIILFLLLASPHIYRFLKLKSSYTILTLNQSISDQTIHEEMVTYMPLVNRLINNMPINDPYTYEHRHDPSPFISQFLPSLLFAIFAKITNLPFVFIAAKIILIPITVFILYLVAKELGFNSRTSSAIAITSAIAPGLFSLIPYPKSINYFFETNLETLRLYYPLFSTFIVSILTLLIIKLVKNQEKLGISILVGIFLGLLFYTYFFAWTAFLPAFALIIAVFFILKQKILLKQLIFAQIISLLIGIPYFIHLLAFQKTPLYHDFSLRNVYFPITENYIWYSLRYVLLAGLVILVYKRKNLLPFIPLVALILVTALLPDISQFILKVNPQSDHWFERFLYPYSTFLFLCLVYNLIKNKLFLNILSFLLILLVLNKVIGFTVTELSYDPYQYRISTDREQMFFWINANLPKNSVVAALNFSESIYLADYTKVYPYFAHSYSTLTTADEASKRFATLAVIYQLDINALKQMFPLPGEITLNPDNLMLENANNFATFFGIMNHFDNPPFNSHQKIRNQIINLVNDKYEANWRIDYLLVGPFEQKFSQISKINNCPTLFSNKTYTLLDFHGCKK